ncbi:PEP-CTERM/exosortase system-associated acyltransferase [Paucibacter sp. R3-3]|uniref:PEP-CTERM/exosortase system-associated acyltransferase n=1 Tax=Roseateles agri TaxID=3098619 RepID=A0ABU5DNG4_9BURK|nr:PEP-CTERM/exosortase system-associated acyltransferase [Paucibacter sp. R3-3]MDY0747225.1 PEP-CTERM/exosortase system-associated acyltransferase [Paucibacter sp. R3-3]
MDSTSSERNLGIKFQELFELTPALDAASIESVYRIRHEVYCRDLGWEPVRADGMETDEYDPNSIHCLLRSRGTAEPIGCTRLVLARPGDRSYLLPFEHSCKDVIHREECDPSSLPRDDVAEVSRLAVMGRFRQRKGETSKPVSVADEDFESRAGLPRFPFIPVSLYLGAAAIARRLNIENVFVLTEPRLASHFGRIGFDIRPIGGAIEHRGTRVPSLLSSSRVVAGLRPLIQPLYAVIEKSVTDAFERHPEAIQRVKPVHG